LSIFPQPKPSRRSGTTEVGEEDKCKLAPAKGVAEWYAEFVASSKEERLPLQVQVRPSPVRTRDDEDGVMEDGPEPAVSSAYANPDFTCSAEDGSVSSAMVADPRDITLAENPPASFSLRDSDFTIDQTAASEKLLNELPLYKPLSENTEPELAKSDFAERLDTRWNSDIVPTSRFTMEKIHVVEPEAKPPSKRSRFHYVQESPVHKGSQPLPPEQTDVALFQPENKHMRDRIHPGQSFRPPFAHPMPMQSFFKSRSSSQWNRTEDEELRRIVQDYSYNWSLISSCLTARSMFSSGADQRTPWECFKRWTRLKGLSADLSKASFFRAYHTRTEAAGMHIQAQLKAAQQRTGANCQINQERPAQPVSVRHRRTQIYLARLNVMKVLAKKREMLKQKHQADLATMRKEGEANQPRPPISTPIELLERQEIYPMQPPLITQAAGRMGSSPEYHARLLAEAIRVQEQQKIAQRNPQQNIQSQDPLPNLSPQHEREALMISIAVSATQALIAAETFEPVACENTTCNTIGPVRGRSYESQATGLEQMRKEVSRDRFCYCEAVDNYGCGMWRRGRDDGAGTHSSHQVYILCHHGQCGRMNWKTIHGFRCHITRCHKEARSPGTVDKILQRYGVPVAAVQNPEAKTQVFSPIANHQKPPSHTPAQVKVRSGRGHYNLPSAGLHTCLPETACPSQGRGGVVDPELPELLRLLSRRTDSGFIEGEVEA
jgi:hypothetical protein